MPVSLEELIVDDAQFWDFLHDPLSRRIWSRLAFTRFRVLDEMLPIPDDSTDIQFAVQDAIAPFSIAVALTIRSRSRSWRYVGCQG
jgi:hypothetical protein